MYEIEIEYKQLLSEKEYNKIKRYFLDNENKENKQINYYFETANLDLKHNNQALRIRKINNSYILCLKKQRAEDILENNIEISKTDFDEILAKPSLITKFINEIPDNILLYGSLETDRIEMKCSVGLLCLDESLYNGIVDYEIEFEAIDYQQEEFLKEYLENLEIEYQPNKVSKIERFMKSINKEGR